MKLLLSAITLLACLASTRIASSAIHRYGNKKSVNPYRLKYITKTVNLALIAIFALLLFSVLGYEYSQLSILFSSVFAVLGVVLFAQWSILSNITASVIIFFGFPYRVGDHVRILDPEVDIRGIIEEITLFHILIKNDEELITYPNTMLLQRGVVKNPKPRQ